MLFTLIICAFALTATILAIVSSARCDFVGLNDSNGCRRYNAPDGYIQSSRAFITLAIIFGVFGMALCGMGKLIPGVTYGFASIFSALTFLLFASDVCESGINCSLLRSANMTIVATIFYLVSAVLTFVLPDKDSEGEDGDGDD